PRRPSRCAVRRRGLLSVLLSMDGTAERLEVTVLVQRGEAVEPMWQVWTRFPRRLSR
ncbi:unnamed protein product, partial [Penicillium discolor]